MATESSSRRILRRLIHSINSSAPKRDQVLVHSFPDFDDTTRAVVAHCVSVNKPVLVLADCVEPVPTWARHTCVRVIKKRSLRGFAAFLSSRYVVFTHGLFGSPEPVRSQIICNAWHGMPLKRIGLTDSRNIRIPAFTFTLATSDAFVPILAESFGVDERSVKVQGLPRYDVSGALRRDGRVPELEGDRRIVAVLPTYRRSVHGDVRVDGDANADGALLDVLSSGAARRLLAEHNVLAFYKAHPMAVNTTTAGFVHDGLLCVNDAWLRERSLTLYEILAASAALITDYSSAFIDFLPLDRPLMFYVPDYELYAQTRGFYFPLDPQSAPGALCRTPAEVLSGLSLIFDGRDMRRNERADARKRFHAGDASVDNAATMLETMSDYYHEQNAH